jgi:hypothetical protein
MLFKPDEKTQPEPTGVTFEKRIHLATTIATEWDSLLIRSVSTNRATLPNCG